MSSINNLLRKRYMPDIMIVFCFLLITVFMTYPMLWTGNIIVYSDWSFHGMRVEQIFLNMKRSHLLTFIATDTFQHTGVGNFLFYPTVFLYPWAFFRLFLKPVTAFYCWYGLIMFSTFAIAYFSMKSFGKRRIGAVVFSLAYTLGSYHLYLSTAVFGEFIAMTFLPLAFWAFYEVLFRDSSKWPWLGIGMTMLIYSHVLSVMITSEIMLAIFIMKILINGFDKQRFICLLKAVGLTILLALFIIIPYLTDFIGKGITSAQPGVPASMLKSMIDVVEASLNNAVSSDSIGFLLFLAALFGYLLISSLNSKIFTAIYILGLVLIAVSTSVFPWSIFSDTPFGMIQLPVRYLAYATLFLSVVFGIAVDELFKSRTFSSTSVKWLNIMLLSVIMIIISYSGYQHDTIENLKEAGSNNVLSKNESGNFVQLSGTVAVNNSNYNNLRDYSVRYGELDYYPVKARRSTNVIGYNETNTSIVENIAVIGKKKLHVKANCGFNVLRYTVRTHKDAVIDLPVLKYNGSYATVDGRKVEMIESNRGTVKVRIKKGVNRISIGYEPPLLYYLGIGISALTWFFLVSVMVYRKSRNMQG